MVIYAAELARFPEKVLSNSGIDNLIHDMIQKNHDPSLVKQMRNEITSLMQALSEKYSSDDIKDTLVVHPSPFDSIKDNSSESGYSSKHVSSSSNDSSDSDWQVSQIKNACARSGESASDIVSTFSQNAHHQCRLNMNYITDSLSQDSNNAETSPKGGSEFESKDNNEDEDNESGVRHFKG
jgi:hypothetical protein